MKPFDLTYFVLDFDRCIGNTDKAHEILWQAVESETGIDTSELAAVKKAMEAKGFSFDTMEYVAKELLRRKSTKSWQDVRRVYVAVAKQWDILEPHARELLNMLDERQIPYGILTYGKQSWQLTKLEAAGLMDLGVPFEVTQIEHKGGVLTGWKHGDEFIVPPALTRDFQPLHVQHIVFLDDKPRSFEGLPEGVRGICVHPVSYSPLPSQQGDVPVGVEEVQGIGEAIELLFDLPVET